MWQDIRYAFRTFAKNPVFTLIAVITIALGVGPNSAIFSIINAVLLRPLPYHDPGRIVMLWQSSKQLGLGMLPVSGPDFSDWKRDSRSFEDMSPAFTIPEYGFNVTAGGEPERAQAGQCAANFFSVLGVKPVLGRFFSAEEDRPGANPVVLISQSFWTRRFGASWGIIGQPISLDGMSRTVVGVLPKEVESLGKVDLWIPIAQDLPLQPRNNHQYGIMARLKPGVTASQAQIELQSIAQRLQQQYPATNQGMDALVVPIDDLLFGHVRPALLVMLAAVGFLLLIACANVANLLLARAAGRQKEIAVRAAVGASRTRILRQLLTESVLLGVAGGLLGLLLGAWSIALLRAQLPDIIPRLKEMGMDTSVLLFSLGLAILTGILFGLAPALRGSKTDLNETLKEGGGKGISADSSQSARTVLLVAEVALAFVLLAGAGLLIRSFLQVTSTDPGFRPDHILTMQMVLPEAKYRDNADVALFVKTAIRRVESLPGVRSVAAVNILPARSSFISLRVFATSFQVEGEPAALPGREPIADYRAITPRFFDALGIPLRKGRIFDVQDTAGKQAVVIINDTLANRYFRNADPVGRRLRFGSNFRVIAGVVGDVKMQGLEARVEPAVYVPYEQNPQRLFSLAIRGGSDPSGLTAAVRTEILAIDPDQPISDVRTMNDVLSDSLLLRRLSVWMLGTFAGLALLLATVGIYGLTSYSVSRRTHEIGLRMALGASQDKILRLVVWRGVLTAVAGVALGLPAAIFMSRFLRAMLFGVGAMDPATFVVVPIVLVCASALACYIPARRAMRIDPINALRYE